MAKEAKGTPESARKVDLASRPLVPSAEQAAQTGGWNSDMGDTEKDDAGLEPGRERVFDEGGRRLPCVTAANSDAPVALQQQAVRDPLLPERGLDEFERLKERVKKKGGAPFSSATTRVFPVIVRSGCIISVVCRTDVRLVRNLEGKRGETRYVGVEIGRGTFLGPVDANGDSTGGSFVEAVIKFKVRLDLSATRKGTREANNKVRKERKAAGKRHRFKGVTPLEFILIHEEQHVADACRRMSAIALRRLRCRMNDARQKALRKALKAEFGRIVDATKHEKANSKVEEEVRRRTWEEFDRRQPGYRDP